MELKIENKVYNSADFPVEQRKYIDVLIQHYQSALAKGNIQMLTVYSYLLDTETARFLNKLRRGETVKVNDEVMDKFIQGDNLIDAELEEASEVEVESEKDYSPLISLLVRMIHANEQEDIQFLKNDSLDINTKERMLSDLLDQMGIDNLESETLQNVYQEVLIARKNAQDNEQLRGYYDDLAKLVENLKTQLQLIGGGSSSKTITRLMHALRDDQLVG